MGSTGRGTLRVTGSGMKKEVAGTVTVRGGGAGRICQYCITLQNKKKKQMETVKYRTSSP